MITAAVLVVTMDVLKYGFGIDPVKEELEEIQDKRRKKENVEPKKPIIVIRYLYVHSSPSPISN